jgi:hypothetical protein
MYINVLYAFNAYDFIKMLTDALKDFHQLKLFMFVLFVLFVKRNKTKYDLFSCQDIYDANCKKSSTLTGIILFAIICSLDNVFVLYNSVLFENNWTQTMITVI